jgi:hypothetical protein
MYMLGIDDMPADFNRVMILAVPTLYDTTRVTFQPIRVARILLAASLVMHGFRLGDTLRLHLGPGLPLSLPR